MYYGVLKCAGGGAGPCQGHGVVGMVGELRSIVADRPDLCRLKGEGDVGKLIQALYGPMAMM